MLFFLTPKVLELLHWNSFQIKGQYTNYFIPKSSSTRELPPTALLDANSLLHLHFTLAILSCILPFRSSPLALACAAADLYFSSLCCNASSTVFGSCTEAWNKKDSEKICHSDFRTYKLPLSYPSLPSAETKLLLKTLTYNSSKGSLLIFYFHYWSIKKHRRDQQQTKFRNAANYTQSCHTSLENTDLKITFSPAIFMASYKNPEILPEASWVWDSSVARFWELPTEAGTFCLDVFCTFPKLSRSAKQEKQEDSQHVP